MLRGLSMGEDPLEDKARKRDVLTLGELVELYLTEGHVEKPNKKPQSWDTDRSNLNRHVLPLLGTRSLTSLGPADIARLQSDIIAGKTAADVKTKARGRAIVTGGKATAARAVAVLGATLEFAVGRKMLAANPAKGVSIVKVDKRERFLVDRELVALGDALAAMEEDGSLAATMGDAIRLLLLTGCRKQEILRLQWRWVDFDRFCLRLPDSKTGAKIVALGDAALELLAGLDRTSDFVFPSRTGTGSIVGLQKAWSKVRARATATAKEQASNRGEPASRAPDLTNVRIHDLRHSYASVAVADGASLFLTGKLLDHRQASSTAIYAHIGDDPLRAVATRTASKIASVIQRKGSLQVEQGLEGQQLPRESRPLR